jgi:plastocyanin
MASRIGRWAGVAWGALVLACGAAAAASAAPPTPEPGFVTPLGSQVQHLHFRYGPLQVLPGQNLIMLGPVTIEKPAYDGYMVGFRPNLVRADGTVPPVDQIHLHHGVWLNVSAGGRETRFAASGEEKTRVQLPPGFGYPVRGSDGWLMNYMLHNQTPVPEVVYITYDVDFVPAHSPVAAGIKPAYPLWVDVQDGSAYPVFDVHRDASDADGTFTYPAEAAPAPYPTDTKNSRTITQDGTLIWSAGHVHPGGLHTDLYATRGDQRIELFRSDAKYYDPAGPVSWDMSMTATPPDYRVGLRKGDKLTVEATYDHRIASWYESMGIEFGWVAPADGGTPLGPDPFASPPDIHGAVTHGHLPENDNHGGAPGSVDPEKLPDGPGTIGNHVGITGFEYLPGNAGLLGSFQNPPPVARGTPLTFDNFDWGEQIYHTITACKAPCNGSTGISYPLADGPVEFDSGELGYGLTGLTAAANRSSWATPPDLPAGTYAYFCRIHPFMRGAFRVK